MPFKGVFGFFCGEHMAITISETEPPEFYSGVEAKPLKKVNKPYKIRREGSFVSGFK